MSIKKYERMPKAPKGLNKVGEDHWEIYCHYYLDRDYLTADLLPDIEHLCYLQQNRVKVQDKLNGLSDEIDEDLNTEQRKYSREIRQYKKHMRLYPRSNEFSSTSKTQKEKKQEEKQEKEEKKMTLLKKKKAY